MGATRGSRAETPAVHWAQGLGEARHARDECGARTAKSEEEDAARRIAVAVERWAAIVAGIRRLADAYNIGARRMVLSVVEQSGPPTVTVAVAGEGNPYLTAALEDTLICVHACDAGGVPRATEVRLCPDRSDEATAAYVLQHWMQRL
jgi:hypothetical protein